MIVNVKEIVEKKKQNLKIKIAQLRDIGIIPCLAFVLANNEEASKLYISKKRDFCKEMGIEEIEYVLDANVKTQELIELVDRLNKNENIDGILIQLPLFKHIDEKKILDSVIPEKDVDGFSVINVGRLFEGRPEIIPCTPKGILSILKELDNNLIGKNAVVIGRSQIVGRPMAALLLNESMTVTVCHSKTKDLKIYTENADIIISATGMPHIIKEDMVKEGAVVIDVGMSRLNNKLVGDVDTLNVDKKAKYVTPVPGGVGLTTVYSLIENVVEIAERRRKK